MRARLQLRAIRKRWTRDELHREIIKKFGRRRTGGRRHRVARHAEDLLAQVDADCENWRRWQAEINRTGRDGTAPVQALPRNVRERMTSVSKSIEILHSAVQDELAKAHASRKASRD
jgi:hypothetical protein